MQSAPALRVRLATLRNLAAELVRAQSSLANFDLTGIQDTNETLREGARLLAGSGPPQNTASYSVPELQPAGGEDADHLMAECEAASIQLRRLNAVQDEVVRNSQKIVQVLLHLAALKSVTYSAPRAGGWARPASQKGV